MTGTTRSSEGLDMRRRRLLYRAWHRGTREMDLVMGRFADDSVATLSDEELTDFEALAEALDGDLYAWVSGEAPVPDAFDTPVFRRMRTFNLSRRSL